MLAQPLCSVPPALSGSPSLQLPGSPHPPISHRPHLKTTSKKTHGKFLLSMCRQVIRFYIPAPSVLLRNAVFGPLISSYRGKKSFGIKLASVAVDSTYCQPCDPSLSTSISRQQLSRLLSGNEALFLQDKNEKTHVKKPQHISSQKWRVTLFLLIHNYTMLPKSRI